MKFIKVNISNFRQYHGVTSIDLETTPDKNIIIIGGKNGYGKTNLLLSIVWCLYGDKISNVDENFKREIQKEKNYALFMKQSLNWNAPKDGNDTFWVEILINDLNIPEFKNGQGANNSLKIKRKFNVSTMDENLSISPLYNDTELFDDDIDKLNFINDYIIPLDAAKFVFFDAEKISEIANLSVRDEGSFINDALGKILGLDSYETLIEDLEIYTNNLRKEGAAKNLQEQIINSEKSIEISKNEILHYEEEIAELQKRIDELRKDIRAFNDNISQHSKKGNPTISRENIVNKIEELHSKEADVESKFNELSEIIPLAILTGKLEEISEHLEIQDCNIIHERSLNETHSKIEDFIERLFNKPPEPDNSTFSLKDKMFYFNKAQTLGTELFKENTELIDLDFDHDLNNSERRIIYDAIALINTQSKDLFESIIEEYNSLKTSINELSRTLNRLDADLEDEIVLEYTSKKENAERELAELHERIGTNKGNIEKLNKDISRINQSYSALLKKVEINQFNRVKINKAEEYLAVLSNFIETQKELKKDALEKNILNELKILMHKLNSTNNKSRFIETVKVTILAQRQGMGITLYDQDDNEIRKETLSSGEKQIYISCLIKAILKESVQTLPIFIDTPLGRLDEEHRDSITTKYYPDLSEQVILFSTNSEITPRRFKEIESNVAKSYLLVNDGVNTHLKPGYFKGYEN